MPDFAGGKTQRANKYAWLRAPQTPPPGLQPGLHRKTTFCLSASPAGNTVTSNILRQPVSSFPAPAGQHIPPHVFLYQPHSLPPAHNLHSGNTFLFSSLFFLPLPPFHATKKRKPTSPVSISFSFFSYNSNPSISFAISFTALLAVQSVYSSAQATQWSYMNATRSPVSLILALISAIFSSSSFFNSF